MSSKKLRNKKDIGFQLSDVNDTENCTLLGAMAALNPHVRSWSWIGHSLGGGTTDMFATLIAGSLSWGFPTGQEVTVWSNKHGNN